MLKEFRFYFIDFVLHKETAFKAIPWYFLYLQYLNGHCIASYSYFQFHLASS